MNPVVETFGELFDVLKEAREAERKASLERLKAGGLKQPFGLFSQEMFDQALQMAATIPNPWVINKAPGTVIQYTEEAGQAGDTITYDVNNPATWEAFVPPDIDWSFEVPTTPKRKRRRK